MHLLKFMKVKLFTLIELIVVIVVLGILAAVVIPNISSFKEDAERTSIISNVRNLQTSVDMFILEHNGATPTMENPSIGNPQTLEVYGLHPKHTRQLPKNKGVHWWLDYNHTVWASYVDAPQGVEFITNPDGSTKLSWKTVDGAELYKIYKSEGSTTSSIKKGNRHIQDFTPIEGDNQEKLLPELTHGTYLVSAVDKFDFESVPTKVSSLYVGYKEPNKDFTLSVLKEKQTTHSFDIPFEISKSEKLSINQTKTISNSAIAIDYVEHLDQLWTLDYKNNGTALRKYDSSLNLLESITISRLDTANDIWVDSESNFYTTEWNTNRISKFNSQGTLLWEKGYGAGLGVTGDEDYAYFAVRGKGLIKVDKSNGNIINVISLPTSDIQVSYNLIGWAMFIEGDNIYFTTNHNFTNVTYNKNIIYKINKNTWEYIDMYKTDSYFTGATYKDGQILLLNKNSVQYLGSKNVYSLQGEFITNEFTVEKSMTEAKINLDIDLPNDTSVIMYASNDKGLNWEQFSNNSLVVFKSKGDTLKFKFVLNTSNSNVSPKINSFTVSETK